MASRKLVRDFFFSKQIVFHQFRCRQLKDSNLRASPGNGYLGIRQLSILNEFSKKLKGEAQSNPEFRQSIKEIEQKAEKLKEVKEDLKVRTKQTTEKMYKRMDGVWIEAEATAKKVSANIKEKLSATKEEVKETFGLGNQNSSSTNDSRETGSENQDNSRINYGEGNPSETIFSKFKSGFSTTSPKVSSAFEKLKDTKIVDLAKQGYDIVKDELTGKPSRKKQAQYASSASKEGRSTRTDIVVVPTKQSRWGKKWEAFKNKMHNHPIFKRVSGISEPVMTKSHEFAEDVRERWETSDHPVVHKIQDLNETMFGETAAAQSFKEIRRRDPSFSLPEFLADVQEMIRPTLNAYFKGDVEILKKNCSPEVIERCKAERTAYESQGIFFDNKLLHISDAEIRETKLMGTTPIIIVAFQTQQVYCVRDRHGSITEGGKDTIHTVFYAWAMQQVDAEELGEGALFPIWRLREMQQLGMQALI